jgi:monomeric sarcosine oxidase
VSPQISRPSRQPADVAVIGAGVFGAWTAVQLLRSGRRVVLVDAFGPGNARSSSGGESRIIRMGYGAEEVYTRMALRSFDLWQEFFRDSFDVLFHQTGVLWLARDDDPLNKSTLETLRAFGVRCSWLSRLELEAKYPQIAFAGVSWAILEPLSGVIVARRAVQEVVRYAMRLGATFVREAVRPPAGGESLSHVTTESGVPVQANTFVFACGAWLPRLFPGLLTPFIQPTRQEVFFFGTPPGDTRFAVPALPAWIDFAEGVYGIPDLEHRGMKIAIDRHGPAFDPDRDDRLVTPDALERVRDVLARRFPALQHAPLLETRVCQYENSWNGDFLIDRHPGFSNVWIAGGGSGHGFKHGPAVGEYVASLLDSTATVEPRFTFATKSTARARAVY